MRMLRRMFERITGLEVESAGSAVTIIDPSRRQDAWFSYNSCLRSLFADKRVDVVVDAGANTGQFALSIRKFFAGEIHSFEPVSATYEALSLAAAGDANWHVHRLALGAANLEQQMNVSTASDFSSLRSSNSWAVERFGDRARQIEREVVSIRRLDTVLGGRLTQDPPRRIFLKLDTQGYDLQVVEGLGDLNRHVVALQSELSLIPIYDDAPHWIESLNMFERAGFGVVGLFPVSVDAGRVVEYDCVMSRKG